MKEKQVATEKSCQLPVVSYQLKIFMRRIFVITILFIIFAGFSYAETPKRIVSLKPNITEILFDLGIGNQVVGVTTFCDYPEAAKKLPKVADYTRPFLEPLIALKPDIVIGSKEESSRKSIEAIQKMGIDVELFPFTTLDEITNSTLGIAKLVGRKDAGDTLVSKMKIGLRKIQEKWKKFPKQKILVVWGKKPLVVGGNGTYMSEIINIIGAQNAVLDTSLHYPRWGLENVIATNPDVIIDLSMGSEAGEKNDLKMWSQLTTVTAVRNKKIYSLNNSLFRPSPRIVDSIEKLGELIHENVSYPQ